MQNGYLCINGTFSDSSISLGSESTGGTIYARQVKGDIGELVGAKVTIHTDDLQGEIIRSCKANILVKGKRIWPPQ